MPARVFALLVGIRGVADNRSPAPTKRNVICHHLNYSVSEAGLAAMAGVDW